MRRAIVVVHGMGVQDRFQFLTDFKQGLLGYSKDYAVEEVQDDSAAIEKSVLRVTDKRNPNAPATLVDVHEAYWGNLFNGITKWQSTTVFAATTLYKVLPSLWSRVWKKRLYDVGWVTAALAIGGFALFGIYGGFRLSALRLEYADKIHQGAMKASEIKEEQLGIAPKGFKETIPGMVRRPKPEQRPADGWYRDRERWRYNDPKTGEGPQGQPPDGPNAAQLAQAAEHPPWNERAQQTIDFVGSSYKTLWSAFGKSASTVETDADSGLLISFQRPMNALSRVPISSIAVAAIYCAAFALVALGIVWFVIAQISLISGFFRGRDTSLTGAARRAAEYENYRAGMMKWWKDCFSAIRKTAFPLVLLLILDPIVQLPLVQLFFCAAALWLVMAGAKAWITNFLGDVQIYSTSNENSDFWKAREEATAQVAETIRKRMADPLYDSVTVVAHSLGTVVALNAVRRLAAEESGASGADPQLPRIAAFVTIGSPLRKFRQLFRVEPYKWAFAEFNVRKDRHIFHGEHIAPCGNVPWFNYWFSSDIFADRLAYIPGPRLQKAIDAGVRGVSEDALKSAGVGGLDELSAAQRSALDAAIIEVKKVAIKEADPVQLDRTGFPLDPPEDVHLGFRAGVWTHSDYWLTDAFVDPLLDTVLSRGGRPVVPAAALTAAAVGAAPAASKAMAPDPGATQV